VRENVDAHELAMIDAVATADARAYELQSPQERREYLTRFSVSQANELFKKWKALDEYLLVKFIDGNTKHQNPDGSFKNNGHSNRIPPQPMFPGYSDTYKRAVAK
jgi:hypothetical protein